MLVLTRREQESIWIDDKIQVKVVSIRRGRVRLGFEAPSDIVIDREEVRDRRTNEKDARF